MWIPEARPGQSSVADETYGQDIRGQEKWPSCRTLHIAHTTPFYYGQLENAGVIDGQTTSNRLKAAHPLTIAPKYPYWYKVDSSWRRTWRLAWIVVPCIKTVPCAVFLLYENKVSPVDQSTGSLKGTRNNTVWLYHSEFSAEP